MSLSLDTRGVGKVTIVRCNGRIVAGTENEALRAHISGMMRDRKNFVLHLGDVALIDSTGLGTMVRLLTSTRQTRGDLKLCNVPQNIDKVLKITNLTKLFETHDSEESAISAFYHRGPAMEQAASPGRPVICIHPNNDVLAYLRELLHRGGYEVHTSTSLRDSMILIRVTRPDLILMGPGLTGSPAAQQAFDAARANIMVIELGPEFSTLEAGEAATQLLENIQTRLPSQPQMDS
ncbi:MAG: anti-sigma factor antagonist [Terriglobales bacterium]